MSRELCFLDSSAATKLVVAEPESAALAARLEGRELVASGLLVPEVSRAVRRVHGHALDGVLAEVLDLIAYVAVDRPLLARAAELDPPALRTSDAVHLASALLLGPRLDAFVAYDDRLLEAARAAGLPVEHPWV